MIRSSVKQTAITLGEHSVEKATINMTSDHVSHPCK